MFYSCKVYRLNSRLVQRYDSARRRDLYLRTHSAHKRHISIFRAPDDEGYAARNMLSLQ